ncbi:MAG: histidine ammonia-lyase [Pseudomonadota bacterium]
MKIITIDGKSLNFADIDIFLKEKVRINIAHEAVLRIKNAREFVESKLGDSQAIYGVNTGFGRLASKKISTQQLEELQQNLIISHAAGVGDYFPDNLARLIMLLRANVLAAGFSGIKPETLELLKEILNKDIIPLIPCQGSVGASGDLSPLAHIALVLLGMGKVKFHGKIMEASSALEKAGLKPVKLAAKEGLALINGTQAMCALGATAVIKAQKLVKLADIVGALSIEGDRASLKPFDERIHKIRPHPGQLATAQNVRRLLEDSEIINSHLKCKRVQDPYSFRCIPQVHGAVKDSIKHCGAVIERELNSCTDNPLVFADDEEIISGGNFHGEPLAMALDFLTIALAELGSISERRVAILLSPLEEELSQKYLVNNSGLNSGLAPLHVTMAALVSENKTLAHPASVDSIPTFAGQEDHVSMGLWGARKSLQVAENIEKILAIELLAAAQAIDLGQKESQKQKTLGKGTSQAYELIRKTVSYLEKDRLINIDIQNCLKLVASEAILTLVEASIGSLRL